MRKEPGTLLETKISTSQYRIKELEGYATDNIKYLTDNNCFYLSLTNKGFISDWTNYLKNRRIPYKLVEMRRKPKISNKPGSQLSKIYAIYTELSDHIVSKNS